MLHNQIRLQKQNVILSQGSLIQTVTISNAVSDKHCIKMLSNGNDGHNYRRSRSDRGNLDLPYTCILSQKIVNGRRRQILRPIGRLDLRCEGEREIPIGQPNTTSS